MPKIFQEASLSEVNGNTLDQPRRNYIEKKKNIS
jgi:hypothetical protein